MIRKLLKQLWGNAINVATIRMINVQKEYKTQSSFGASALESSVMRLLNLVRESDPWVCIRALMLGMPFGKNDRVN